MCVNILYIYTYINSCWLTLDLPSGWGSSAVCAAPSHNDVLEVHEEVIRGLGNLQGRPKGGLEIKLAET